MSNDSTWRQWLGIHGSRLMLYARQLTRCEADAEDVLQSALVKTWRSAGEHEPTRSSPSARTDPESHRGLVFANIRRCAIDLGRKLERRKKRDDAYHGDRRNAGEHLAWFELPEDDSTRELQVALTAIPEKYREVITLKIWGELTFAQIGANLDISPNTAASRYRYGLETLRTRLVEPASPESGGTGRSRGSDENETG